MISANSALKLLTAGIAAVTVATGCATAKKGEMAEAAATAPAAAAMAMTPETYTVKQDDNLWCIAGFDEVYGDPFDWPIIYSHNRAQIKDADLIFPGQIFNIPREFAPREVANARAHARSRGAWSVGPTEDVDTAFLAANPI